MLERIRRSTNRIDRATHDAGERRGEHLIEQAKRAASEEAARRRKKEVSDTTASTSATNAGSGSDRTGIPPPPAPKLGWKFKPSTPPPVTRNDAVAAPHTDVPGAEAEIDADATLNPSHDEIAADRLLSRDQGVRAFASAPGNLGPPSAVLSASVDDWLKDRWQMARDLTGASLPVPQWIAIDLGERSSDGCSLTRLLLDWETAYANHYRIETASYNAPLDASHNPLADSWHTVIDETAGSLVQWNSQSDKHYVHERLLTADLDPHRVQYLHHIRYIRIFITGNATPWGSSLWRIEVYGTCSEALTL
jgi:hypothetical protein